MNKTRWSRRSLAVIAIGLVFALTGCASFRGPAEDRTAVHVVSRTDVDPERARTIPSLIYAAGSAEPLPLAVLSHGYGADPKDYTFLAEALARRGYIVASIDHELPTDDPLPSTGDVRADRTPSWRASVDSIRLVRDRLVSDGLALEAPVVLVGHSHGGDASMMMATDHPEEVSAVFSLDNRRYPLPRHGGLRVCTLRSIDQSADPGVLPGPDEFAGSSLRVEFDPDLKHDDMSDAATDAQRTRMEAALARCLG